MTSPAQSIKAQDYGQLKYDSLIPAYDAQANPMEPGSLSWIFGSSLEEVRHSTSVLPITEPESRLLALDTAESEFEQATKALQRADTQYAKTGIKDIIPSLVLIPYATAYENFQAACPGGGDGFPDCKPLRVQQVAIQTLLGSSFDQSTGSDVLQKNLRIYLDTQAGLASIQELPAVTTYDTENYSALNLHVGVQFTLGHTKLPPLMQSSGPTVDLGTSLIFGSTETLASSRATFDVRAGWQQSLFSVPVGNLSFGGVAIARAGLSRDYNRMNFGGGELPQPDTALMFGANGMAGINVCWPNSLCFNALGGYSYDRSLAGDTRYQTSYPTAGLTLSGAVASLKSKGVSK